MKRTKLLLLASLFAALAARAADVEVKSAWVRGTVPAQTVSGAFMEIASAEGATLVGASSPLAEAVELHEMRLEGGVMKMRAVARLALPAGTVVRLEPGGYHIMLLGLKRQLKPGEKVPLELRVENAAKKLVTIAVAMDVRELGGSPGPAHHEHKH